MKISSPILLGLFCPFVIPVQAEEIVPKAHHPDIESISLFASTPDIVTPIGIAVAPDGRVFVQENQTHKRTKKYVGPETDRILIFEDTDGDGVSDKRSVFYEGHVYSTDLLFGEDGHLYVSTRWFICRFPNAATLEKAEGDPEILVTCETEGDYPHNGVGGLAIDPANPKVLSFGFGENLGVDYTFVGSDDLRISGGGEGGSTYRCRTDGSQLERISTGHWNAFGMAYDLDGNLFSTDNDPNSTPPNRLLHIIPGADFGYEYRYGRSGRHPLVDWYGRNPGTLGMIGSLGEAACGLVPYGAENLLSASWTDNRIDLHPLKKSGASFVAGRKPFISGPDNFRPVHFSYSSDRNALYFTDWVNLSYPVHGQGRIWKVSLKKPVDLSPRIRPLKEALAPTLALTRLGDSDPYVRTEAMEILRQRQDLLDSFDWKAESNPTARAHYAVALKRADAKANAKLIPELLKDAHSDVRYVAIKWIADEGLSQHREALAAQLKNDDLKRRDLLAVVAALAEVSGNLKKEFSPGDTLLALALNSDKSARVRTLALQSVPINHPGFTIAKLSSLAKSGILPLQKEAIRCLAIHSDFVAGGPLSQAATDASLPPKVRADAIAGLASYAGDHQALLKELAKEKIEIVSVEATRTLVSAGLATRELPEKPDPDDIAAWEAMLGKVTSQSDPEVGRRLFFHRRLANCSSCHAMNGRGAKVGPDLTTISQQGDTRQAWLLEHILNPNAEVAPYFRPQSITNRDGKTQVGFILGQEGRAQAYVGPDGKKFSILKEDVLRREELPISLMPPGLLDSLSASEIRNLIAYLMDGKE